MKSPTLYLETSVWNYLLDDKHIEKQDATRRLLEASKAGQYEIFVSELVLIEIQNTPDDEKRDGMVGALETYRPVMVELNREILDLATLYTEGGVLTVNHWHDAVHVASAVVEELDVVVSWNLGDLVRYKTRKGVEGTNILQGYKRIDICTPEEVIEYES